MHPRPTFAVLTALALFVGAGASGCSGDRAPDAAASAAWTLGEPQLTVGVLEGDPRYEFQDVISAWRDGRGRLVAVDRSEPAVRVFGPDGDHLSGFAQRGQGPGEIAMPWAGFPYPGDSIAVFDLANRRISIFDAEGRFGRSVTVAVSFTPRPGTIPSQSCCQVTGVLGDGSFLVHPPDEIPNQPGPPRHADFTLLRLARDGSAIDTLGTFPSRSFTYDPARPNNIRSVQASVPFLYTPLGDRVVGGNGESAELAAVGPDGLRTDPLRLSLDPEPFTGATMARIEEAFREEQARRPEVFEGPVELYVGGDHPEHVPLFTRLMADEAGRLWAQEWAPPFSRTPHVWNVFDGDGLQLAHIELPAGSRPVWIGSDEVLLVVRDELGVERLELAPILGR
jgi:hypothetical protein